MIRTLEQRQLTKDLKLQHYLSSKDFEKKRPLLYATLDTYVPFARDLEGVPNGSSMAELLACVLERDRTFFAQIRKRARGAALLKTRDGWESVTRTVAALIVERYLRAGEHDKVHDDSMLTPEELRDRIDTAYDGLEARAKELEAAGMKVTRGEAYTPPEELRPKIAEGATTRLFEALTREVALIEEQGDVSTIPVAERDREVAKRALARLRLKELRAVAKAYGLDESGAVEQLAERLAEFADDDAEAVARMVIEGGEPSPDRGLVTALFALQSPPDVPEADLRFRRLKGNFARLGIARWFICETVTPTTGEVVVGGRVRYYSVAPKLDFETASAPDTTVGSEVRERYGLASDPSEASALMKARAGVPWLEVETRLKSDVSALASLAGKVAGLKPKRPMPFGLRIESGPLHQWERRSVVMLGLVLEDLMQAGCYITNVSLAHFEAGKDDTTGERQPSVTSVRVGGQHLMSHRQVCELLVNGRAFTQVSGTVKVQLDATNSVLVPFRIELGEDSVSVSTGFTSTTDAHQTAQVHGILIEKVRAAVTRQDLPKSVEDQAAAIIDRASGKNPVEADIGVLPG